MSFMVYDGAHLDMHKDGSIDLVVALMSLHHVE
jgi:hypothetical protein